MFPYREPRTCYRFGIVVLTCPWNCDRPLLHSDRCKKANVGAGPIANRGAPETTASFAADAIAREGPRQRPIVRPPLTLPARLSNVHNGSS
jgi:hypothetical protein